MAHTTPSSSRSRPAASRPARRIGLGHRRLAAWYHQLAQQLEAGLPLAETLQLSRRAGMPDAQIDAMTEKILHGGSTDEALRVVEGWLPLGDLLALSASAEAGRMPRTLHHLSARHEQLHTAKMRLVMMCAYPLAVLHFGLVVFPVMALVDPGKGFQWSTATYLGGVARNVLPLWACAAAVWYLARRGNRALAAIVRALPLLGRYARRQAMADFCFTLASLIEAGVPIGKAWAAAGLVTRTPQLRAAAEDIAGAVEAGRPPSSRLATWSCFPPEFVALYRTGEQTGQLDVNLHRLAAQNQEEAGRALTLLTTLFPLLAFLVVALVIVYQIFAIYGGYLKSLLSLDS